MLGREWQTVRRNRNAPILQGLFARMGEAGPFTQLQDVAEAVWRAANDPSSPMRIPAGADAVALASSTH